MWSAFKTMIEQLFSALTVLCSATEKLAKSVDNSASAIEVSSRSLIPTEAEIASDLEISLIARQVAKAEQLAKLKLRVANDPAAVQVIENKLTELQKANQPKPKP